MTGQGNEEWGDFSSSPSVREQWNACGRLDGSTGALGTPQSNAGHPGISGSNQRTATSPAPGGNALPGIFGAYQQQRSGSASSGDLLQTTRTRTTATRNGICVPTHSRNLTLERTRRSEIDTKELDAEGLKRLEKEDPFMFHSIPAVSSASRFWDDVDLKEVQRPSRATIMKSMDSCPAKMMTFSSSRSSGVERCTVTTVKRRTRISHEVHASLLAIEDEDDECSSGDSDSDDDDDDVVAALLRVMSKATV